MFSNHNRTLSGFLSGLIISLVLGFSTKVHAQLTVQPSTNRVGVGPNITNPAYTLDVNGTVNATGFRGDGSQLTNLPPGSQWTTSGSNIYYNGANVGVGNTTPGYKLDVTGTVNATAFRGDGSQLTNLPGGGGASAALNKVTANTTVVSTAAETNLYSFSVSGGTVGTNNLLRLTVQISDLDVLDGSNCVFRLKYGGTTVASVTISNNSQTVVTNAKGLITVIISGDGATNAQIGTIALNSSSSQFPIGVGQGTSAVDSTASQTLLLTVDWSDASSGNSITLGYAALEKVS